MQHAMRGVDRHTMFYWQVDRPFTETEIQAIFLDRASNITYEDVRLIVSYGLGTLGREGRAADIAIVHDRFEQGSVNLVYKVGLRNGEQIVARIHPKQIHNGYFWVEKEATNLARQAGVPTYTTYLVDDTQKHVPHDFMLLSVIPGVNMKAAGPFNPELEWKLVHDTGYVIGLLHGIKTERYGFFDNQIAKTTQRLVGIHQTWYDHLFAAFENNLQYLRDAQVLDAIQVRTVEQLFSKYDDYITCDHPTLIQNDLADWNTLIDGERITGIVDWDECYSGDPVAEFAAWSVFYPVSRMEALLRGYQEVRPLPDGFDDKFHLYRLRYIVSKLVGRKKKLKTTKSSFIESLLIYGMEIFQEEIRWFTTGRAV